MCALLGISLTWPGRARAGVEPVPPLAGPINDTAQVLGYQAPALAERVLRINREMGVQLVLLTVPSLNGEPIAAYAHRVSEAWHLGEAKRDTGLLLLIVPQDRQTRLEVGYGLEGVLPDALAKRLLAECLRPAPGGSIGPQEVGRTLDRLAGVLAQAQAAGLMPQGGSHVAGTTSTDGAPAPGLYLMLGLGALAVTAAAIYMMRRLPEQAPGPPSAGGPTGGPRGRRGVAQAASLGRGFWHLVAAIAAMGGNARDSRDSSDRDDDYRGGGGRFGGGGSSDRY